MKYSKNFFLQTAGVVSGLPYTFIICILCVSLWRAVKVAAGDLDPFGPKFAIGLFDCLGAHPLRSIWSEKTNIFKLFAKFVKNIVLAPYTVGEVSARLNNSKKIWAYTIAPGISFVLFIIMHIAEFATAGSTGLWAIGWFFYLCFATIMASVRLQCRDRYSFTVWKLRFFLSIRFYVKLILKNLEVVKLPFLPF